MARVGCEFFALDEGVGRRAGGLACRAGGAALSARRNGRPVPGLLRVKKSLPAGRDRLAGGTESELERENRRPERAGRLAGLRGGLARGLRSLAMRKG